MPELRKDPIHGRWVIISTERSRRPSDFTAEERRPIGGFCPLCEGNEDRTPPEILAFRDNGTPPDSPGWTLRVVPNKFPALRIEGELDREGEGIYDKMNGVGAHEVVIETPRHEDILATLPLKGVNNVLHAYRERIIDLRRDQRLRYVLVFKNHGLAAGASLEHSHSQIIALPIVPKRVSEEIEGAKTYFNFKDRCVFCDIIRQELQQKRRIITENKSFLSIAPFASRFPFETWILPKTHYCSFEHMEISLYEQAAQILSDTLQRIYRVLNDPPYNFVIHTSSFPEVDAEHYHWHFEIMPKLTKVAGFEWGTGFYINPTPPEEAAEYMREAK
ncbi:MAG: putative galactose-1-phosphate uridyl transferase (Gal-1-P uridylyltransferase) [Deltaproteobacteria bacterium]|nr:putative galactose-1-phosphate uridyl transferase (Gal-1-P uridylyltransferase) [Deltaproteobacteria bacterium]